MKRRVLEEVSWITLRSHVCRTSSRVFSSLPSSSLQLREFASTEAVILGFCLGAQNLRIASGRFLDELLGHPPADNHRFPKKHAPKSRIWTFGTHPRHDQRHPPRLRRIAPLLQHLLQLRPCPLQAPTSSSHCMAPSSAQCPSNLLGGKLPHVLQILPCCSLSLIGLDCFHAIKN